MGESSDIHHVDRNALTFRLLLRVPGHRCHKPRSTETRALDNNRGIVLPLKLLFIHGTGVRQPAYSDGLARTRAKLHLLGCEAVLEPCYWGETCGARLNAGGASIPNFDPTRAIGAQVPDEELEVALWALLYRDPLFECRLLKQASVAPAFSPKRVESPILKRLARGLDAEQSAVIVARICAEYPEADADRLRNPINEAMLWLAGSTEVNEFLRGSDAQAVRYAGSLARAVVARASQGDDSQFTHAIDAALRDTLVETLTELVAGTPRGFLGALLETTTAPVYGVVRGLMFGLTALGAQRRGNLMQDGSPIAGDILLYQAHGKPLRDFIRERIRTTQAEVLLAHSLGGVACVDLLLEEQEPSVKLLVTAGSQAPYFYEINALQARAYDTTTHPGERLPHAFPKWLNLYDHRDFLSFIGGGVFGDRVIDTRVNNRQPFPRSHSSYWSNVSAWEAIRAALAAN